MPPGGPPAARAKRVVAEEDQVEEDYESHAKVEGQDGVAFEPLLRIDCQLVLRRRGCARRDSAAARVGDYGDARAAAEGGGRLVTHRALAQISCQSSSQPLLS